MIGMAAGLALRGRVPIAHALAAFLTMRAFEFVRTDGVLASCRVVGGVPGFLSDATAPPRNLARHTGHPNFATAQAASTMTPTLPSARRSWCRTAVT